MNQTATGRVEIYARTARVLHWLTVLLVAVPVAGYIGISPFPALDIYGFKLPGVVAPDQGAAKSVFEIHRLLALALVALIVMHVGAALFHHLVHKDNVLARMLPSLLKR